MHHLTVCTVHDDAPYNKCNKLDGHGRSMMLLCEVIRLDYHFMDHLCTDLTLQVMGVEHMYTVADGTPHTVLDSSHCCDGDVLLLTQGHYLVVVPIPLTICSTNKPHTPM